MRRSQKPIPPEAAELLELIPETFTDDGLSLFPDRWFGFDFAWAGRIHDWEYCGRCHAAGHMNVQRKTEADVRIGRFVSLALPWRWKWLGRVVRFGVWRGGYGAYNSCGSLPSDATEDQLADGLCRHEMPRPDWMT